MLDIKVIGEGSFSRIVQIKIDNQIRVIKKLEYEISNEIVMLTPKTIRELVFLQYINSEYVIKPTNITNMYLYMRNEGNNLYEYINELKKNKSLLHWQEYKLIFWQIARGIFDIHNKGIIHGDIKPQNILYDNIKKNIKICDFNFATLDDGTISGKAYTLQYRPLESLLSTYNNKSDIWALGCTMWEIFTFIPLFEINRKNIETDVNEYIIHAITSKLGSPTEKLIKKYNLTKYIDYFDSNKKTNTSVINFINNCDNVQFDIDLLPDLTQLNNLIIKMLSFDINDRPSARDILNNSFFNEFHSIKIPNTMPNIFELGYMTTQLYEFLNNKNKCDNEFLYKWAIKCVLSRLYLNKELNFYDPPAAIQKKFNVMNNDEIINIETFDFGIIMQDILQVCNYDLLSKVSKNHYYQRILQYF